MPALVAAISREPVLGLLGHRLVAARAFLLAVIALCVWFGLAHSSSRSLGAKRLALQGCVAAGVSATAVAILDPSPHLWLGAGVFLPALSEELVFRLILPALLLRSLRRAHVTLAVALVLSCVIAQVAFALSHSVMMPVGAREFGRLVAAGLLFAELVRSAGLWAATGLHTVLNYLILTGEFLVYRPSLAVVALSAVVGFLALLRAASARPHLDPTSLAFDDRVDHSKCAESST